MSSNIEIERVCEFCGKVFTAHKTTTRYCSLKCNSKAYKASLRQQKITTAQNQTSTTLIQKPIKDVKDKELLTISDAAIFIGVSRPTIYSYLQNGELRSVRLGSKTFIRRIDIDTLFDKAEPYKPRPNKERQPITEFYTIQEVAEKYNVTHSWVFKLVKENNIPKILDKGRVYYSKQHIDSFFKKKGHNEHQDIVEWYSVQEVCDEYTMTLAAVYSFVYENGIPKKKDGKMVYYSKPHFDAAKNKILLQPEYYTVEEAMQQFSLTRDSLYWYLRTYNIPRIKNGRFIKISKPDLDRLFAKPIIP